MTELDDFGDLIDRLRQLGDALDLDGTDLTENVIARVRTERRPVWGRHWLVAAAALAFVAGVMVYPDSRQAVARWFGFDGLSVEVDPDLSVPPASGRFDTPGPGETVVVDVDGQSIIVSAVSGSLNETLISKTVGSSDQITEVRVDGRPGLWFSGSPHEVLYESKAGDVVVERVAANTLVWQDGDVLFRVEGFDELTDALAYAEGT